MTFRLAMFSTLAPGRLFRQGQKAATFLHQNISRTISRPHTKILLLWKHLDPAPNHYQHHCLPCSYYYGPLSSAYSIPLVFPPQISKIQIPPNKIMVRRITAVHQSLIPTSVLVRVSVAVKRHHDHSNSYKGKLLIGVAYSSEVQSIINVVGNMAVYRQT